MTGRWTTGSTRAAAALGFGLMLALSACERPPESRTPWVPHLKRMDEALARNDLSTAQRAACGAAFARLGDHAVVDQCLFFARILAERAGGDAPQRVAAWTERLAGSGASAKMTEPF